MAIHPDVPGLEVGIDVNGQNLPEYEDIDAEGGDTSKNAACIKYVESVSGATFGMSIRFDAAHYPFTEHDLACSFQIDGQAEYDCSFDKKIIHASGHKVSKGVSQTTRDGAINYPSLFSELDIGKTRNAVKDCGI